MTAPFPSCCSPLHGEVCQWWGVGGWEAWALHYLALLLRMDPQLDGFKVVAGHKPLLQGTSWNQNGRIKVALIRTHSAGQPRDMGEGRGVTDGRR